MKVLMIILILKDIKFYIKFNLFFITKIMNVNCDELFNILFSDKNNPYKNYILNFVDIFCNKHIYHPFIDTFYLNKTFNFDLNISFFNKNHIYLLPYRDYFYYNPFVKFDTYISNPKNSIFIFNYFLDFCSQHLSNFVNKVFDSDDDNSDDDDDSDSNKFYLKIPDASDDQIKIFFIDLNFFYNIAYKLFNIFQYIFYCFIFKYDNNFNNIENDLIKLRDELETFKSTLFFSNWLSSTIFKHLIFIIDNLNNNFLLNNFYFVKFLIEFSLSFHYFYLFNISFGNNNYIIFNSDELSNVLYFRSVLDYNIFNKYLPKIEIILSNIKDNTIFNNVFRYFTFNIGNIIYLIYYNLLKSLKNIFNKLLLPLDFTFDDIFEYDLTNKDILQKFLTNGDKLEDYISNFYINGKLRFNNCLINDNLFYISDKISNNNFVCINTIYPINCLAFNTDLFSITYDDDNLYYTNNSHSISLNKKDFYSYFWNLFYNNNFYFFISSSHYTKFNVNTRFLFNLLPYIPYKIEERFDATIYNFLRTKLDVGDIYIPLLNICPLNFKIKTYNITFIDLSFILLKLVLESRRTYLKTFNNIINSFGKPQQNNDQNYLFLYLLYVFIHIYIFNTIHSFNENESFEILNDNGDTELVDYKFIPKCVYLFNMYFIHFLYKVVDFSDNHIKIKSNIRDDIIKDYDKQLQIKDFNKFYHDLSINNYLSYILNDSFAYEEKNDIFSNIKISNVINIIKVIKNYVVSSDDKNISKNFTNIENQYQSNNDDFNFNVYNILYQI
jgi:hypothetical protein